MKKQSEKSPMTTSGEQKPKKDLKLNLAHLLVLHALLKKIPKFERKDQNLTKLISDILWIFEYTIDNSDNEVLKNEFNYKPILWQEDEADETATNPDDDQTVQEDQKKEVEPTV